MLRVSPRPELLNDRLQSLLRQKSRPFARPAGFHLDVHTVVGVKPGEPALLFESAFDPQLGGHLVSIGP